WRRDDGRREEDEVGAGRPLDDLDLPEVARRVGEDDGDLRSLEGRESIRAKGEGDRLVAGPLGVVDAKDGTVRVADLAPRAAAEDRLLVPLEARREEDRDGRRPAGEGDGNAPLVRYEARRRRA